MHVYEHRTPNMTPAKFNDCKCQMYPYRELKGLQKLRNIQYVGKTERLWKAKFNEHRRSNSTTKNIQLYLGIPAPTYAYAI